MNGIKALGAVDIPRGEFWNRHREIFLVKEIASVAHVYDKRLVDAESFTTWRRWADEPQNTSRSSVVRRLELLLLPDFLNPVARATFVAAETPPPQ